MRRKEVWGLHVSLWPATFVRVVKGRGCVQVAGNVVCQGGVLRRVSESPLRCVTCRAHKGGMGELEG